MRKQLLNLRKIVLSLGAVGLMSFSPLYAEKGKAETKNTGCSVTALFNGSSATTTVTAGIPATFTDQSTVNGYIDYIYWDFSDGAFSSDITPAAGTATVTYPAPGMYSITMTAYACSESVNDVTYGMVWVMPGGGGGGVPDTRVANASCIEGPLAKLSDPLYCEKVKNAEDYSWEYDDGTNTYEYQRGSGSTFMRSSWVTGVKAGVMYSVRVKAKVGGVWGDYSSSCTIYTLGPIKIATAYCPYTVTNFTDPFYCVGVAGAQNYEWEFNDGVNPVLTKLRGTNATNMRFKWVPGAQLSTTYSVRVRVQVGGVWSAWGPACDITTSAAPRIAGTVSGAKATGSMLGSEENLIELSAYPNPTEGRVTVDLTQSVSNATIKLINLAGQVVMEKNNLAGESFSIDIADQPAGFYFVEVAEGDNMTRTKLIKY